jgi:hypothetical protein
MAVYELSTRTTVTTATALTPIWAFLASTTQRAAVREIQLFNVTAPTTSGGVGLMRSTALGTATTTNTTEVAREPGAAASDARVETAWSAAPTVGTVDTVFRRWHHGTAIGNGIVWTFDLTSPLIVPLGGAVNGKIVLVNLQATVAATYDVTIAWED